MSKWRCRDVKETAQWYMARESVAEEHERKLQAPAFSPFPYSSEKNLGLFTRAWATRRLDGLGHSMGSFWVCMTLHP